MKGRADRVREMEIEGMGASVAVVFAVPHEAAPFLRRMRQVRREGIAGAVGHFGLLAGVDVAVMAAGMGGAAAGPVRALLEQGPRLRCLWMAGYGGGLDPALRRGDVVVSVPPGFALPAMPRLRGGCTAREGRTAHVTALASTAIEKRRVFVASGAPCCDMESGVVGPIAEERGIPWGSVRAISDAAGEDLPARLLGAGWDAERGRATPLRLIQAMVRQPGNAPGFLRFVAGLGLVRENLARVLVALAAAGVGR